LALNGTRPVNMCRPFSKTCARCPPRNWSNGLCGWARSSVVMLPDAKSIDSCHIWHWNCSMSSTFSQGSTLMICTRKDKSLVGMQQIDDAKSLHHPASTLHLTDLAQHINQSLRGIPSQNMDPVWSSFIGVSETVPMPPPLTIGPPGTLGPSTYITHNYVYVGPLCLI
jgi:hypothetical protein